MKKSNYIVFVHSLILFFLLIGSANLFAQINAGGQPLSNLMQLESSYNTVSLPSVDTKKAIEEDAAVSDLSGIPYRYGLHVNTDLNLNNSGTWETLSDGSRIWRLGIKSEGAKSLNLLYDNFYMPKGAFMFVYDLAKTKVIGAFTEINNNVDGQFATDITPGFYTVIEYYEPSYAIGRGRISISKVVHAYKDINGFNNEADELACNINVICPIGAPWVNQKRAVARMTFSGPGGSFLCSGSLINNTLGDRTPYFLSAQHCESTNWSSLVATFNFESQTCSSNISGPSQTMQGATLKASNFDTDFMLLQFNNAVPSTTNAFFNGWDVSGAQPLNETAIHHPDGAIKKISYDENPAASVTGFGGRLPNGFWLVIWEQGMTEGGSSGCPLYDQNQRVIGQNLGGTPSQCTNPQIVQKYFGKISESWAHGGSSTNQLKNWLDPNNSGVTTLNGINDLTGVPPVSNFSSNVQNFPIGGGSVNFLDYSTNDPQTWTWSFPGGTPSTSTERNPTGISYTATGAYAVSLTTSNSFGTNLMTKVNYITVAGVPLNPFSLQSPPPNSTILVVQNDPSIVQFKWSSSSSSPTVKYIFRLKKLATTTPDLIYQSDNNGSDTVISLRKSFLDSVAVTLGLTGDSVRCTWRVSALNGLDTLSTPVQLVTIRRIPVGITQISSVVPERFNLYNNYPNPFNPATIIKFDISKSQPVKLSVYDMLGKEVSILINQNLTPGSYSVDFNANSLSSGMYFYRIETAGYSQTKRMILVK